MRRTPPRNRHSRGRAYRAGLIALSAITVGLVACGGGGGGGGSSSTPSSADKDAAITLSGTSPAQSTTGVSVGTLPTATFALTSGTYESALAAVICGGTSVVLTSTVANGVATFTPSASLPYNAACSYTGTVTAKGDGAGKSATVGWTTMFQTEARPVLHYANVIFGMAADNGFYPMKLEGSTCASMKVTAARNDTKFQTGFFPLFNGWMLNAPQASGRILVAAQAPSDGNRRNGVILDPVANVLSDYNGEEGAVPSMDEQNPDPRWINTGVADNPDPAIGGYADTPTMLVYVTRVAGDVLLCKEKATGVVTEVSRTSGGWKAFIVYSNN